jgi:hypothetical protein
VLLGVVLVEGGGVVWFMCEADQELDDPKQTGRSDPAGDLGAGNGGKKRKTSPPGVETSRTSASLHSEISEESALIPEVMVIDANSVT